MGIGKNAAFVDRLREPVKKRHVVRIGERTRGGEVAWRVVADSDCGGTAWNYWYGNLYVILRPLFHATTHLQYNLLFFSLEIIGQY